MSEWHSMPYLSAHLTAYFGALVVKKLDEGEAFQPASVVVPVCVLAIESGVRRAGAGKAGIA